jgi:DNA replication and repair protein RecF
MILQRLALQYFRSYTQQTFSFSNKTTFLVGPNTAGKTNMIEGIFLLATGKSFRAEKDTEMVAFGQEIARVKGIIEKNNEKTTLETLVTQGIVGGRKTPYKRYLVNGVPKRRVDFAGRFAAVLFSPVDLELISEGPSVRRGFLNDVLELVDSEYRRSLLTYEKALRQRNALLAIVQETGRRPKEQFSYWDTILITHGQVVTKKREAFLHYLHEAAKDIFAFQIQYDSSTISEERLAQYRDAEVAAGVTLVGPQRDDFIVTMTQQGDERNIKHFASRGQQRLVVLQLKLLQLQFMEEQLGFRPVLLLDDIFSELDDEHIHLITSLLGKQQSIVTTTHEEFVRMKNKETVVIPLAKETRT